MERNLTGDEFNSLLQACRALPPAKGNYLVMDFIENLLLTVLDYQMHTTAVKRAMEHYKKNLWNQIRTIEDLKRELAKFSDNKEGNTALALHLWGYKLWTRAGQLRGLVRYFDSSEVRDQEALKAWAQGSEFKRDFAGQVKGLGPAVYNWLVMRQGVETIKPDVHILGFFRSIVPRPPADDAVIEALKAVAKQLGLKAYELDWRIWEYQREVGSQAR